MARDIEHKVTTLGLQVIARCIALSIPVTFTKASLDLGIAQDADDLATYTGPIQWFDDAVVAGKSSSGTTLSVALQYLNSNVSEVINIGGLCLYADDPVDGEVLFSYTTFGQYMDKLLPIQQTPILKTYEVAIDFANGASVSVTINPEALLPSTDAVDAPAAGKLLRLNAQGKLPASITGDAATVGGNSPIAFATVVHVHSAATTSADGFMSSADKISLNTLNERINQGLKTTDKPTFAEATIGVLHGARYEP